MTYASIDTLNKQFGPREVVALTDRNLDGLPDIDVVAAALAAADSLIDSYLRGRYPVPLVDVPPLIVTLAGALVRYHLSGAGVAETDPARDRYRDAIKLLESIRDGVVSLGPDPAGDQPAQAKAIRVVGGERQFGPGAAGMEGFQ